MDPWQDPAGRPEDPVFQAWDDPVFSEQEYLDLYTALSESAADQRKQEQVKNEETAGTPAGPELKPPVTHNNGVKVMLTDDKTVTLSNQVCT